MATTIPLLLNKGIDLVTPPLLSEAGTLLDSRNYEMSADVGYRRWDGFERRDGYPTGGFFNWYSVELTVLAAPFADIQIGDTLFAQPDVVTFEPIGVVVSKGPGTRIDYVPYDTVHRLFPGNTVYRRVTVGAVTTVTSYGVATSSVDGRTLVTVPETYLTTTRAYQTLLRNLTQPAPSPIAGLFFSRDRSYEALNTTYVEIDTFGAEHIGGEIVRYNGFLWIYAGESPVPLFITSRWAHLIPLNIASAPVNTNIVGVLSGTTKATLTSATAENSDYAYLTWLSFPGSDTVRGRNMIRPGLQYTFINGTYASSASGPPTNQHYYVTNAGGGTLLFQGRITQISQNTGGWVAGTATGRADFQISSTVVGQPEHFIGASNFEVHTAFPTGVGTRVFTVNVNSTVARLAGTGALAREGTHYQWGTYNFYASVGSTMLFGTNGIYRAFYGDPLGYSNIYTQEVDELDNPKYLTFHAGVQLGLGFAEGSFQMSVGGVPWDFSGVRGALEIGTGDDITGVLEGVNDSSLIFGRRSIRRVTGTTDTTMALETISANAGAFDYSCVNVGSTPMFTGPTGVSTLQQAAEYGDFIGERATSSVSTRLIPKLVSAEGGINAIGVVCAFPVRNKQQYRLFLRNGDVVTVTLTTEGPKTMFGSYKLPNVKPGIPIAWSSAIADDGDEHLEVVWDRKFSETTGEPGELLLSNVVAYRLDNGWGFDGNTFEHWFDVAYTFVNNGAVATRVEKARLYGMSYGIATLDLKASSIEKNFDLPFSTRIQSINMPGRTELLSDNMEPATGIVDHQNWGFGVKLRINGTKAPALTTTEPSHICQVLVLHLDEEGAQDG